MGARMLARNRAVSLGIAVALLSFALPAAAQGTEDRPYIFGGYSYTFVDDARGADNGSGVFAGAGKAFNARWDVELTAFHNTFDAKPAGADWRDYGASIAGLFHYSRARNFSPFLALGVGGIHSTQKGAGGGSSDDGYAEAGLGFFKYFDVSSSRFGLRAEVRGRWLDPADLPATGALIEPIVRIGLVAALGEPTAVESVSFGPDRDGDGVGDDADVCPATPRGTRVDRSGCPPDTDRDGILDDQDLCPGTSVGAAVTATGCPVPIPPAIVRDSDGDGVGDEWDRCPDSVRGLRVDERGCVLREAQRVALENVTFRSGAHQLTKESKAVLERIAAGLKAQGTLSVEIAGHTDSVGADAANLALSKRRAESVRKFLADRGIGTSRLTARGYGESEPVADNKTAEGRARNRRVEFRVLGNL